MEARLLSCPVSANVNQLGFGKNIAGTAQSIAIASPAGGKRQCKGKLRCRSNYDSGNEAMKRRELLLGTTIGAAGLPFLINSPGAMGSPVQPPDLKDCKKAGTKALDCCLPVPKNPIKDFILRPGPVIDRPAAHLVGPAYAAKYSRAYELLRALPDDDPRKQIYQAYIHCVFCDNRLVQPGTQNAFDVHGSWLFLPWHRWYLYFHERILQYLIKDPSFRLPYWNWDNPAASSPLPGSIPSLFIDNPSLYDAKRSSVHQPPAIADLGWFPGSPERQDDLATLRNNNNAVMYQNIVSGAKTASLFLGQPYRAEDVKPPGGGRLEGSCHASVHVWTGSETPPFEDMGALYSAGIDPIFFAHHGNVDRIWSIWTDVLKRNNFTDSDFLNAAFEFFDEHGDLVKVKARDALDSKKMGYSYQPQPIPWLTAKSTTLGANTPAAKSKLKGRTIAVPEFGNIDAGNSTALENPFSAKVKIPAKKLLVSSLNPVSGMVAAAAEAVAESDGSETVLVIQGVEFPMHEAVGFDIFINLPTADSETSLDIVEYAGSFLHVPHMKRGEEDMATNTTVRIGIGEVLEDLGIKDGESFDVTLVPKNGGEKITIKGFDVEYQ